MIVPFPIIIKFVFKPDDPRKPTKKKGKHRKRPKRKVAA